MNVGINTITIVITSSDTYDNFLIVKIKLIYIRRFENKLKKNKVEVKATW